MTNIKKSTKSARVLPHVPKYKSLTFKVKETILTSQPSCVPINLAEEKAKFIRTGIPPQFEVKDVNRLSEIAKKAKNQIRFNLLAECEYILELLRDKYGDAENYLELAYGPRITTEEATRMLLEYIEENALTESLKIHWCDNLTCSAKMVWRGPMVNVNRPERRKYSLWISSSEENNYLRESGIRCLMDHEIGTHFFRMFNDGFQPWFSHRSKFGLRNLGSFKSQCTEEGLASVNTALRGRAKFLWGSAFTYYTACKSAEMNFKDLFDHIGRYTSNIDYRWKQVMRVKRGLVNPNDLGGLGNDQCYFEGAVSILRNVDSIDFNLLMSGKVCVDELDRIKRVVRKDFVRLPTFMHDLTAYKNTLKKMATINGLNRAFPLRNPPAIDIEFLKQKNCKETKRFRKVRKIHSSPSTKMRLSISELSNKPSRVESEETVLLPVAVKEKCNLNCDMIVEELSQVRDTKTRTENIKTEITSSVLVTSKKTIKTTKEDFVKSFELSERFVNKHEINCIEEKRKQESSRTMHLMEKICSELSSLDENLDVEIQKLQKIVKTHVWSSNETGYKEKLIKIIDTKTVPESASKSSHKESEIGCNKHSSYSENIINLSRKSLSEKSSTNLKTNSLPAILKLNLSVHKPIIRSSLSDEEWPKLDFHNVTV